MEIKKNNLLVFFDYVYYTIASQYDKWRYTEIEFSGIIILSLIQQVNVYTVLNFFKIDIFRISSINPIYVWLIGAALLFTINGIRYKKIITYDELHKKWGDDNKKSNFIKKALVLFYIIVTIIILIISLKYNGSI